jgi:hypothetical protein
MTNYLTGIEREGFSLKIEREERRSQQLELSAHKNY